MAAPRDHRSVFSDDIRRFQWTLLQQLLDGIIPANPFYAAKVQGREKWKSLDDFVQHCPFTTKAELSIDQQRNPPFGSNRTFPQEQYVRFHQTSGTTGTPLRFLDTAESWGWMLQNWNSIYGAAGVTAKDRIIFAFSFGPFIGFWLAFEAAASLGALCLPTGGFSTAARLRLLIEQQATVLCCTPTYAFRLAEVAAAENISLVHSAIRLIIVAGEPGGSILATRRKLGALWPGARIFDHHGMTEVGPVSYECPKQPGDLHILSSRYFAEVIDRESHQRMPQGGLGELVLTPLGRSASPLLRYRTGDLVKLGPPRRCVCGRNDELLEGAILGRTDDMVVVRGVNIYPSAVEELVRRIPEVGEYRVRILHPKAMPEMIFEFEPAQAAGEQQGLRDKIQAVFTNAFLLRVNVVEVPQHSLPRTEMKSRRWLVEHDPASLLQSIPSR